METPNQKVVTLAIDGMVEFVPSERLGSSTESTGSRSAMQGFVKCMPL